ncbi:MAG: DNA mismatch repair endonuclease MutL, partial [Pseudobdellovibrio sp.]
MATIQILSSEIINQIAAGEVVERPAHLVKELVENSLDAGSDQITVEVGEGGRSLRVLDNGHGILSEDLEKALQRHATSKITKTDDLWNLHTFGFRGEALASAAAVSNMTLKSFEKNEKKPAQIHSQFGKISDVKPSSQTSGTEIKIEDLFENVPARLKFLKSETSEIGQIKSVIKALALAHPNVEFKLISNGDLQFYYKKRETRLERVQDVLEKAPLFEAKGQLGSFTCHAIYSSPQEVAKTSKQIWTFAQNRWIQDRALQAAVMDAYRSLLMHGEYPYAVLWIECNPAEIDVNIHPTKSQVKFQDASNAFRVVQNTLRNSLEKAPWLGKSSPQVHSTYSSAPSTTSSFENYKFHDHSFQQTQFKNKDYNLGLSDFAKLRIDEPTVMTQEPDSKPGFWSSLQVIGQAHLTYIVCQKEDRLVFVDQHAAHERVAFETLMKSWKEKKFEIQNYL